MKAISRETQSPFLFRVTNFFGLLVPFAMTDLFLFISIPMMERRQLAHKPAYAAYRKRTRLFI